MIRKILPHICIIFSGMFAVLIILNVRNPYMGFLTSTLSLWCLGAFCVIAFATAVILVHVNRKDNSNNEK